MLKMHRKLFKISVKKYQIKVLRRLFMQVQVLDCDSHLAVVIDQWIEEFS